MLFSGSNKVVFLNLKACNSIFNVCIFVPWVYCIVGKINAGARGLICFVELFEADITISFETHEKAQVSEMF